MSRRDIALKYFDEQQEFMQTTVAQNIERYRKGDGRITVCNEKGEPIEGAKITLKQKTHAFKYGANIFMLDELETPEKNQAYRDGFKEIFNLATIPFYWNTLEPEQGKPRYAKDSPKIYRRPAVDLCMEYCAENNIEPKCHCLNYDSFAPDWLKDADVDTHKKALDKRFRELSERYADKIPSWEVTNETLIAYAPDNSFRKFYNEDDFVEWSFHTAERYFPNNRLIINDYGTFDYGFRGNRTPFYMQIERLFHNGVWHLDSIGMQFHSFFPKASESYMSFYRYNPKGLYSVLDTFAKFGKALQITEMTIPAYSAEQEDEDIQAELIEKLYTVFFSHPAMEAIIYWNAVDGYAWRAEPGDMTAGENVYYGGLMRFDLTKKKAFHVIDELFNKKWRTQTSVTTDKDGKATFRGFYGDYELQMEIDGKTVTKQISLLPTKNNVYTVTL